MSDKKITELPDGGAVQSTDEFVAARSGGNVKIAGSAIGGSSSPPVVFQGTDPLTDPVTVAAAPGQDGATYIFKIKDEAGVAQAGFDFGGTLDLAAGLHVISPLGGPGGFQIGQDGAIEARVDSSAAFEVKTAGGSPVFIVATNGSGAVETVAGNSNRVLVELDSFGGTADGVVFNGAPDFRGEFRVLAGGAVVTGQNTAPADGDLVAGQVAIWFDQTDGAANVKFKGKSANGTVVSGQVALT